MPPEQRGAPHDGRLNLEQQKKRAKELLRAFESRAGDAPARFAAHAPHAAAPKLADAQFVIARENGFDSWPKLKAHADALALARTEMSGAAPDTKDTLHIRCGSDIRDALRKAGFIGTFHEFSDPFCQGPVRALPERAFIDERARFISDAYALFLNVAAERQEAAYKVLDELGAFERIVLWFEHDSYDQLILAFLLARFGKTANVPPVSLVCAAQVPGVSRFIGLGQLSAEVIRWLWASRRDVGSADLALGAAAFDALCAPSPQALLALASAGTPAIPAMAGALLRHIEELPSVANGLNTTQRNTLEILRDRGAISARDLFGVLTLEKERLPFFGDLMYWRELADLMEAERPAIAAPPSGRHGAWAGRQVTLTQAGADALAGKIDWLSCGPRPRFVGGVEIAPGKPAWRFDDQTHSVQLI